VPPSTPPVTICRAPFILFIPHSIAVLATLKMKASCLRFQENHAFVFRNNYHLYNLRSGLLRSICSVHRLLFGGWNTRASRAHCRSVRCSSGKHRSTQKPKEKTTSNSFSIRRIRSCSVFCHFESGPFPGWEREPPVSRSDILKLCPIVIPQDSAMRAVS
jgi:hypothetical protein